MLYTGMKLDPGATGQKGTLGPFLTDGEDIYTLVATAWLGDRKDVRAANDGDVIGTVAGDLMSARPSGGLVPAGSAFRIVKVSDSTTISKDTTLLRPADDLLDHLGAEVKKTKSASTGIASGIFSAFDAPVYIKSNDNHRTGFEGTFEITSSAPFAATGDAGAPIVDAHDRWLGCLIAKDGDRYYACPAESILGSSNLRLATESDIVRHNARVRIAEAAVVEDQSIVAVYGSPAIQRAEAFLNERAPRIKPVSFVDSYQEAMYNAPKVQFTDSLFAWEHLLADRVKVLAARRSFDAKLHYVVGLHQLIRSAGLDRDAILKIVLASSSQNDWFEHHYSFHEPEQITFIKTSVRHVLYNKSVSLESAQYAISVLSHIKQLRESHLWSVCYIEPAIFTVVDEVAETAKHIAHDTKAKRQYESVFVEVTRDAPQFPHYSGSKILAEISAGNPVRYATAWIVNRALQLFHGRGFKWRTEERVDFRPAAIEDHRASQESDSGPRMIARH